jgi:hypothetical protein
VAQFLNAFLRGDRDSEDRRSDGSISQALGLMNDPFVMMRIRSSGNANLLLLKNVNQNDENLVSTLFLTVLSRYPSNEEKQAGARQIAEWQSLASRGRAAVVALQQGRFLF